MYDVAIIGAGPAGSTLARLLGNDRKIVVVEKRAYFSNIIAQEKCCGGLLAPDAQKMLAKLSLGLPKHILSGPQLFSVCAIDLENRIERYYQRHYINMDREKFDSWLISLIPKDVDTLFGYYVKGIDKTGHHYSIQLEPKREGNRETNQKTDHKNRLIKAKMVVGADGAFSKVRRAITGAEPMPRRYIAVQEWYHVKTHPEPCFYSIFDSHTTDFYSWIIQKENSLVLGSAMNPKDDVLNKFELLKQKMVQYGIDLNTPYKRNGTYLLRPQKLGHLCPGTDGIALIGEAAGFISPSSAEGLSYAMESAYMLAEAIKNDADRWMVGYRKNIRKIKYNIVLKNMKSRLMYHPMTRRLVMKSGISSLRPVVSKSLSIGPEAPAG